MKRIQRISLALIALLSLGTTLGQAQQRKGARSSRPMIPKAGHYLIQGLAPTGLNGKWVYLYPHQSQIAVDSARIQSGKFRFERPADGDGLIAALMVPGAMSAEFIPEPAVIKLELAGGYTTGGKLNELRKEIKAQSIPEEEAVQQRISAVRENAQLPQAVKDSTMRAIAMGLRAEREPRLIARLQQHQDDAIGYLALEELVTFPGLSLEQVERYLGYASERLQRQPAIAQVVTQLRTEAATRPGAMFRDFAGLNDAQQPVRLSDYVGKGHYTLVDFWASWCGPCRREMPNLKKVLETYGPQGLQIVGAVVWDEMPAHLQAMQDLQLPWPQIFNKQEPTQLYGIKGIPQIILFAPDGRIVARDLRGEEIPAKLQSILDKEGKL